MPLKIELKSGERLIINGSVIQNVGPNTKILVYNNSAVLREKEVLSGEDSTTPSARIYFALQCAYIFPHKRDEYLDHYRRFLKEYVHACPSSADLAALIETEVEQGHIYKALKSAQKLITHEAHIIKAFESSMDHDGDEDPEEDHSDPA